MLSIKFFQDSTWEVVNDDNEQVFRGSLSDCQAFKINEILGKW